MTILKIDRAKLGDLMERTFLHHAYRMGAKPPLGSRPEQWTKADCSGYLRWLLYGCTNPALKLPEGSVQQHLWCESHALKPTAPDYATNAGLMDDRLRIAFIEPKGQKAGHVWLVINGMTIESRSGKGPSRRLWDSPVLKNNVSACYVLTEAMI